MYGWRARVGAILVSDDMASECEYALMSPPGVSWHAARMIIQDSLAPLTRLETMLPHADQAAVALGTLGPDVVMYACTSGSFFRGRSSDEQHMLQLGELAGCEVISTSLAVVRALT